MHTSCARLQDSSEDNAHDVGLEAGNLVMEGRARVQISKWESLLSPPASTCLAGAEEEQSCKAPLREDDAVVSRCVHWEC